MIPIQAISRAAFFCRAHRKIPAFFRAAVCVVLASALPSPLLAANTIVRMEINFGNTPAGNIDIELYDDEAPKTVENFLRYAGRGYYDNTIIHRSAPTFIIQGGGYKYSNASGQLDILKIPQDLPIQNEFSPSRSNVRGTIAMAKLGGNPNSATNEWFFNLADNSTNLDNQNGGFTVFGHVLDTEPGAGMDVVDAIADLDRYDFGGQFDQFPVNSSYDPTIDENVKLADLVIVNRILNVKSTSTGLGTIPTYTADLDMVFGPITTASIDDAKKMLENFSSPQNQSVYFNNGIQTFSVSGTMGITGRVIKLYDGAATRPTHYYAYGKTPDNPTDHWYDFSYDAKTGTGAEIVGNKIILYFVDGQRGDNDLDGTNGSITHTGAQAVVTAVDDGSAQGGGCSITGTPPDVARGGDWIIVSLFLIFVALVRKRNHRQRF